MMRAAAQAIWSALSRDWASGAAAMQMPPDKLVITLMAGDDPEGADEMAHDVALVLPQGVCIAFANSTPAERALMGTLVADQLVSRIGRPAQWIGARPSTEIEIPMGWLKA